MKDCDIIQMELSAYVDGELTPHRREVVEAHLATCPSCQEAVAQLKTLAVGVAALPKLQPAPQFLADVRRKIARGDRPEALTWQDRLFHPFWIKVPLELAALVAITISVTRLRERESIEPVAVDQLAQSENYENHQSPPAETEAKTEPPSAPEPAPGIPAPAPVPAPEHEMARAPAGEPVASKEAPTTTDNGAESGGSVASDATSGVFQVPGAQAKTAGSVGGIVAKPLIESRRRVAVVNGGTGGFHTTPSPSAAEVATLAKSVGVEPARISGVVVVRSQDLNDVQGRAEQLAARCDGKVISVSSSSESTGQIFFVEVPREYAASFKLDLEQNVPFTTLTTNVLIPGVAVVVTTNATLLSATSTARVVGVLTGGVEGRPTVETNGVFDSSVRFGLANNPQAQAAATTVLEILVVPPPLPASPAATKAPPAGAKPAD